MPFDTISLGLTIKIPTSGSRNWDTVLLQDNFNKISSHDHSGSGKGKPVSGAGIAENAIDDSKIRLRNNQWLRGRNFTDTGDIQILRVTTGNAVELNVALATTMGFIYTNEPGAAPTGLIAGKTYFQPNYILGLAITYTIVANAYMEIIGFCQVDGTLIVEGQLRVT